MKLSLAFAAMALVVGIGPASATMRIYDDRGGQIGNYLAKYHSLRESGERVVIDGTCASACTMLLGAIPRNRICVTPRAVLAFHSAWTPSGDAAVSSDGNHYLWANYPRDIREWISRHGGLGPQIIYLRGPELAAMYPACRD
ncbi:MAG TPA: hypothetical protein VHY56_04295 [Candidatus Binataceae bacterium]|nr:hypothetical protein [Candidatus Binataceae bacterium]